MPTRTARRATPARPSDGGRGSWCSSRDARVARALRPAAVVVRLVARHASRRGGVAIERLSNEIGLPRASSHTLLGPSGGSQDDCRRTAARDAETPCVAVMRGRPARRTGPSRFRRMFPALALRSGPYASTSSWNDRISPRFDLRRLRPHVGPMPPFGRRERAIPPAPLEDQLRVLGRWFASVRRGSTPSVQPDLVCCVVGHLRLVEHSVPIPDTRRCGVGHRGRCELWLMRQDRADESVDGRRRSPSRRAPGLAR